MNPQASPHGDLKCIPGLDKGASRRMLLAEEMGCRRLSCTACLPSLAKEDSLVAIPTAQLIPRLKCEIRGCSSDQRGIVDCGICTHPSSSSTQVRLQERRSPAFRSAARRSSQPTDRAASIVIRLYSCNLNDSFCILHRQQMSYPCTVPLQVH